MTLQYYYNGVYGTFDIYWFPINTIDISELSKTLISINANFISGFSKTAVNFGIYRFPSYLLISTDFNNPASGVPISMSTDFNCTYISEASKTNILYSRRVGKYELIVVHRIRVILYHRNGFGRESARNSMNIDIRFMSRQVFGGIWNPFVLCFANFAVSSSSIWILFGPAFDFVLQFLFYCRKYVVTVVILEYY